MKNAGYWKASSILSRSCLSTKFCFVHISQKNYIALVFMTVLLWSVLQLWPEIVIYNVHHIYRAKAQFIYQISALSNSIQQIKLFDRHLMSELAAAFLLHARLVLSHYPTEMQHRFKHWISAVSNLMYMLQVKSNLRLICSNRGQFVST